MSSESCAPSNTVVEVPISGEGCVRRVGAPEPRPPQLPPIVVEAHVAQPPEIELLKFLSSAGVHGALIKAGYTPERRAAILLSIAEDADSKGSDRIEAIEALDNAVMTALRLDGTLARVAVTVEDGPDGQRRTLTTEALTTARSATAATAALLEEAVRKPDLVFEDPRPLSVSCKEDHHGNDSGS